MNKPLAASTLNRVLAFGLALTLVAWTFGVYMVLPVGAQAATTAHPNGSLVLSGSTVWKIMDGKRLGYPSANVFLSHGYTWNQIAPANSADLALPQGPNEMFANGTLVNDSGTISIISEGKKRGFTTAAVFTGLGYKFSNVISDSLTSYTLGANVDSATAAHPVGTLVNSSGTIWQIVADGRMGIPSLPVFNSWGLMFAKVVPANAADVALAVKPNAGYRVGSIVNDAGTIWAITSSTAKQGFPTASCFLDYGYKWSWVIAGSTAGYTAGSNLCTGPTPITGAGTLTVALASDTPAAGTAYKSASRVPVTKLVLTATGADVVVDSMTIERQGASQDTSVSTIDMEDAVTNNPINDTGKTLNSAHQVTVTDDITVKVGTPRSLFLTMTMPASPGAGEIIKLALVGMVLKNNATLSGTLPIVGNGMTVNTTITIGTATIQRGAYVNSTNTALEVGKKDFTFFSFSIQDGSAEDIKFSQVKVYQAGSASLTSDLGNYRLLLDGTVIASASTADSSVSVSGSYISFTFPQQTLLKGQTKQYQVKADVLGGSARTVKFSLYRATDLLVNGTTYFSRITPTTTGTGSGGGNPVLEDNQHTISQGTVRVGQSSNVSAANIGIGSPQTIGAFDYEVTGERAMVSALTLTIVSSTSNAAVSGSSLQSIKLVDKDGTTLAGPVDTTITAASAITAVFSDTFTLPTGTNVIKVMATLTLSGNWSSNDTIYASLQTPASANTIKGETTNNTITATPSSNVNTVTQTVKAGALTVTKTSSPGSTTNAVIGASNYKLGEWTLDATASGEDVRVTAIAIAASTTGKINNLTLKEGTTVLPPVVTLSTASGGVRTALSTGTFALTNPLVVTKGSTKTVAFYGDIGSTSTAGEVVTFGITSNAAITATGVSTGNTITATVVSNDGSVITVQAAGTLTVNLDASAPARRLATHGSSGVTLSEVRLKATNEPIDITRLKVDIVDGALAGTATSTYTQVAKFYLKKDGAILGSSTGYSPGQQVTTVNLNRGDLTVPQNDTGIKLSMTGDIVSVGTGLPGVANGDIAVGLDGKNAFQGTGNGSNSTSITETYNDSTGSVMILHRSVPSVVFETPSNKISGSSDLAIHKVKISAIGNTIGIYALSYLTTTSANMTLSNGFTKLVTCTGCGAAFTDGVQLAETVAAGTDMEAAKETWRMAMSTSQAHGKQYLPIAAGATATIEFHATPAGFTTGTDTVSAVLLGDTATTYGNTYTHSPSGSAAAGFALNNQGNFVWSDLNGDDSISAASLTNRQWYNGYLVAGLGSIATSTTITVSE